MSAYHRQKGSSMERLVADYFKDNGFPFADRRVKSGAKDKGDVGGVHVHDQRLAIEVKNTAKISLGTWAAEAEVERVNDEALAGVVVHKRHGKGKAGDQWVTMTLADLTAILTGKRP
jgi:Holliday junction resolvase